MSKKKNTLNDLEEFLKLQASALVTPPTLTDKAEASVATSIPEKKDTKEEKISEVNLIEKIKDLASDKRAFYNLIIEATENLPNKSSEDALLINTALYLKGGPRWKETVSDYWRQKK